MRRLFDNFLNFLGGHSSEQLERFIVWLLMMSITYYIILREDSVFKDGLKGKDKMWQSVEFVVYIFMYMLPGIVFSSVFLKYDIDDKAMWIIQAILLTALGVRGVVDIFKKNHSGTVDKEK